MKRSRRLELRTDERVHDVVRHFERRSGWTIVQEIDSVNYGEGYDLLYGSVRVRLYDDQRSDEVQCRTAKQIGPVDWEREIAVVAHEMMGTVWLQFEIDRYAKAASGDGERAVEQLRECLLEAGYRSEDIRVESA